jgi:3-oxoacyl-[acyl-carrier protein] reductase
MQTNATHPIAGKVAVVTGAAGGLGRTIAQTFASHGASVVACDIDTAGLATLSQELADQGAKHLCLPCDVSDSAAVAALFEQARRAFGTVHILVNNAALVPGRPQDDARRNKHYGYLTTAQPRQSLQFTSQMSDEEWLRWWGVNVHGVFYCTREALKLMEPQREGKIINVASIAGISAMSAHSPHYSATKGAVVAFTKAVAAEVAGANIFVNAMAPGGVQTPTFDAFLEKASEAQRNQLWQILPAGRLGTMQEYADTALYLAGPHYLVGQVISPNGGVVI